MKPSAQEGPKTPKLRARALLRGLNRHYPDARCSLDFASPFQLYVATVLSAQCTDQRVNLVTPALFARFPTPLEMASGPREDIEDLVRSTGFFRNKAKSLQTASQALLEDFGGEVPATLEELIKLPGVGRKTANVILGNCFDTPGITVDTHVGRLSRRMGLTTHNNPAKVERDLMELIPRAQWTMFSHRMIAHGRAVCTARRPACETCPLLPHCPFGQADSREND